MDDIAFLEFKKKWTPTINSYIKENINPNYKFMDESKSNILILLFSLIPFLILYYVQPKYILNEDQKIDQTKYIRYSLLFSVILYIIINGYFVFKQ
jgi:hypothetical protein